MNRIELLQRLEHSLKRALVATREQIPLSGFDMFISKTPEPYMNYAVPKKAENWDTAVSELIDAFMQRQRQPRLEYFHELYPLLQNVLQQTGFIQEMAAPVMILVKSDLPENQNNVVANYNLLAYQEEEILKTFLRRQNLAFGGLGDDSSLSWLESLKTGLQQGSVFGAYLLQAGEIVSGAIIQGAEDGELAGVWTLLSKQKQGLGYTLCQKLLSDYFARGQRLCWLSASEGAQKLYTHLGFKVVGTQLNMSLPGS